jgi:arylsulfatase A-like enzyme
MGRFLTLLILGLCLGPACRASSPPNVVLIYADDLGYGDVQANNPGRGRIPTPHMDRLAAEGLRFTDAHSSSGVCSPSRYTLLTGRYHWRTRLQSGIVAPWGKPLIPPGRLTLASLAAAGGYRTAAIGKWHLGWEWGIPEEARPLFPGRYGVHELKVTEVHRKAWAEVFSRPLGGGPLGAGFASYFGTDVPNWPPYCFIEDNRAVGIPSASLPVSLLGGNLASVQGPALPGWKLEEVLPALTRRAEDFIAKAAADKAPFLLYLPLTSPHTPLAVNAEWKGRSGLGPYADLVMETDAAVGRVLAALDKAGVAGRTLVLLTSDNGCASYVGVPEMEAKGHFPSGPLRGYKTSAFEGGHRVPFLVRWPGVTPAGKVSGRLVHQADLLATLAELLGAPLPEGAGEDSLSLLPLLRGEDREIRAHAVSHSARGEPAVRSGSWKLILPKAGKPLLFNLADDLGETKDLAAAQPDKVAELTALYARLVDEGRSRPGPRAANDVPVQSDPRRRAQPQPSRSR